MIAGAHPFAWPWHPACQRGSRRGQRNPDKSWREGSEATLGAPIPRQRCGFRALSAVRKAVCAAFLPSSTQLAATNRYFQHAGLLSGPRRILMGLSFSVAVAANDVPKRFSGASMVTPMVRLSRRLPWVGRRDRTVYAASRPSSVRIARARVWPCLVRYPGLHSTDRNPGGASRTRAPTLPVGRRRGCPRGP